MIYVKKDGTQVAAFTEEERAEALDVSMSALCSYLGFTPQIKGTHVFLKEMDSLCIYNDRTWHRWSQKGNITGGTQIDFMMEFGDAADVPTAINKLLEFKGKEVQFNTITAEERPKDREPRGIGKMVLPPKNENYKRVYAYLMKTRGLSLEVISEFVHKKIIYEDSVHHNIVFLGYDPNGEVKYAGLRGTADLYNKPFKMDLPGNDKNYGVNIVNKDSGVLKVFESVIDCMSYMDLTHDYTSNKLILGMVEDNPLEQFLKDYDHINSITFCLDNDKAGQQAIYGNPESRSEERKLGLKHKYENLGFDVAVELPESGKDFNEALLNKKNNKASMKKGCVRQ